TLQNARRYRVLLRRAHHSKERRLPVGGHADGGRNRMSGSRREKAGVCRWRRSRQSGCRRADRNDVPFVRARRLRSASIPRAAILKDEERENGRVTFECRMQNAELRRRGAFLHSTFCVLRSAFKRLRSRGGRTPVTS